MFFFLVHGSNPREKLHIRAYLLAPIRRAQFDSVPQHHGYGGGRGGTRRRRGRGFRGAAGAGRLRHRLRGAPRPRRPRQRRRRLPLVAHSRSAQLFPHLNFTEYLSIYLSPRPRDEMPRSGLDPFIITFVLSFLSAISSICSACCPRLAKLMGLILLPSIQSWRFT